jgi:hypothetical protein
MVRLEPDVELRLPGLAAIEQSFRRFAHAIALPIPDRAHQRAGLPGPPFDALEHHSATLHAAVQQQQIAPMGDPALVPDFSGRVVKAVAFAVQAVVLAIIPVDHAAMDDDLHGVARKELVRRLHVIRIPIAHEEIELATGRRAARRGSRLGREQRPRRTNKPYPQDQRVQCFRSCERTRRPGGCDAVLMNDTGVQIATAKRALICPQTRPACSERTCAATLP